MNSRSGAFSCVLLLALVGLAFSAVGTPRITRVGRYLYDADGKRFYIKGVAFQKDGNLLHLNGRAVNFIDPLADANACQLAVKDFRKLKINTVRVYSYDTEKDHSICMNALEKAGIYVIADISLPRVKGASQTWDVDLLRHAISQIDALRGFPNLLAFNIGNAIIKNMENLEAGPYIKARVRDVKLYLKSVNSTALVAYTSADGEKFPADLARFLSCNFDGPSVELDLFGLNNHRWCGDSNFETSYEELTMDFQGLKTAAFFSEFGFCSPGKPRVWTEVPILLSTLMSDLWSGGVAYSYYPTPQGYGLLDITAEGKLLRNQDFKNLALQYHQVKAPNIPKLTSLVLPKQQCSSTNSNSFVITSVLPPQPNAEACNCVDQRALSCHIRGDASPLVIAELLENFCKDVGVNTVFGDICAAISSSSKANYGILSACSPATRLNYAMTHHFINSGFDPKACNFSGNATIQSQIQKKSAGEVVRETVKCFKILADKGIANKPTGASKNTPVQINTNAYHQSISGAKGQLMAQFSEGSSTPNVKNISSLLRSLPMYIMAANFGLFRLFQ